MDTALLNIILYSVMAGLSTGIGALIVLIKKPGKRLFGFLMGFAAGVMVTVSFVDLVNEAWLAAGYLWTTIGFGAGAIFMLIMDSLIPHIHSGEEENVKNKRMLGVGFLLALGIAVHNLPEGIAVGSGYMFSPKFGIFIAIAIALHNIPEGIATALPLYKSGLDKWKSFNLAVLSGMVEPVGAILAAIFLCSYKSLIPVSLAFAAGVMVFISLDELIPTARRYGHHHFTALGIILGTVFMFLLSGIFGI
jgi:ZIP family zinc transporter